MEWCPCGGVRRKYVKGFPLVRTLCRRGSPHPEPISALPIGRGIVQPSAMKAGRSLTPSVKLFRLAHVRKQRDCEQVAAVCYRLRNGQIEFLLVRTGSGHWTFPKGGVEPGLSHAQAAALEAFEEAGVHGRMEEASFTRYVRHKRQVPGKSKGSASREVATSAHLCEVLRLVQPQEANRKPTWFSAGKTKTRLVEGRTAQFGAELVRVVDRAVARIERLGQAKAAPEDALQKVQFEAVQGPGVSVSSVSLRYENTVVSSADQPDWGHPRSTAARGEGVHRAKVLQLGPALVVNSASRGNQQLTGPKADEAPKRKARASLNSGNRKD